MRQPAFLFLCLQVSWRLCSALVFLDHLEDGKNSALWVFHSLLGASGLAGHVLVMAKRKTQEKKPNIWASFQVYVMPPNILLAKASWMAEPQIPDEGQSYVAKESGMGELGPLITTVIHQTPHITLISTVAPALMLPQCPLRLSWLWS